MALSDLCNTKIQIKSESASLSGGQRVESHGSASSKIPARMEHLDGVIMDTALGEVPHAVYKFYVYNLSIGMTIKEGDIIVNEDSTNYKAISVLRAYGMSTVHHIEVDTIKL